MEPPTWKKLPLYLRIKYVAEIIIGNIVGNIASREYSGNIGTHPNFLDTQDDN